MNTCYMKYNFIKKKIAHNVFVVKNVIFDLAHNLFAIVIDSMINEKNYTHCLIIVYNDQSTTYYQTIAVTSTHICKLSCIIVQ